MSNTVVTKKIISEVEARELFRMSVEVLFMRASTLTSLLLARFYHGCSTFLPIFDGNIDTFDALHERSPFAVDCICMVAAQVRDGGGSSFSWYKPCPFDSFTSGNLSDTFRKCQEEVQAISCATLFSPVTRQEAVQAMSKPLSPLSFLC